MKMLICFTLWVNVCGAQTDSLNLFKKDKSFPNLRFSELVNSKNSALQIDDFAGKLLILDCWTINCTVCIKAFPRLSELSKKFGTAIEILPLAFGENIETMNKFFLKRKQVGKEIAFQSAVIENMDSSILFKTFPEMSNGFPVEIWIDEAGILRAITDGTALTEENIQHALNKQYDKIPEYEISPDFDFHKLYLAAGNGGQDSDFAFRSIISDYNPKLRLRAEIIERTAKYNRIFLPNYRIGELLKFTFYGTADIDVYQKLVLDSTRSGSVRPKENNDIFKMPQFCYELVTPATFSKSQNLEFMRDQVNRYFSLTTSLEIKQITYLVVTKGRNFRKLAAKTKQSTYYLSDNEDSLSISNQPLEILIAFLDTPRYPPVKNETGIDFAISAKAKIPKGYDFETVKKEMERIGLELNEVSRPTEVMVIRDLKK